MWNIHDITAIFFDISNIELLSSPNAVEMQKKYSLIMEGNKTIIAAHWQESFIHVNSCRQTFLLILKIIKNSFRPLHHENYKKYLF